MKDTFLIRDNFICDTDSIKDNNIQLGDAHEAEHHFNWETYTPSAGAAGMLLLINGKITWKWKLALIKKISFKLWSRSSYIIICLRSWLVTMCDIWPALAAWWMSLLEQDLIYNLFCMDFNFIVHLCICILDFIHNSTDFARNLSKWTHLANIIV
jgi:hypothetical protein